jgi:hypothetical protein
MASLLTLPIVFFRRLRLFRNLISSAIRRIRYFFCLNLSLLVCRSLLLARKLIGLFFFIAL